MFEVITQSQPQDYQSLEILKEAYLKLGRESDVVGTSKRIAQAYVQMGQLASAIREIDALTASAETISSEWLKMWRASSRFMCSGGQSVYK